MERITMKQPWRYFFIIEALLFVIALWDMVHNPPVLIFSIIAIINIIYALKKNNKTSFNQFQLIISSIILAICLFMTISFWLMVIVAIIFLGIYGGKISGIDKIKNYSMKKKQMIMVETIESESKNGRRFKRKWFGNERIGSEAYEWDDINMILVSGDTIVDLGNTLLPKDDNVIIIRKGIGRTRILVPIGVGVMVEHSALVGEAIFEGRKYRLKNESLKLYSHDYDLNARRLKIITNVLIGDIEVIQI